MVNNFHTLSFEDKITPKNLYLWNDNFFLTKEAFLELLDKKACIRWLYGESYKKVFMENPKKFQSTLEELVQRLYRSDEKYDALLLYANLPRIAPYLIDGEKGLIEMPKYSYTYNPYIPKSIEEVREIMKEYILIDLETTGFTKLSQIIQVGIGFFWERWTEWEDEYDFSTLLRKSEFFVASYKDYINNEITDITGITQNDIDTKGHNIEKVLKFLYKILHWRVVAAHNAIFDYGKICEAFIDFRMEPPVPSKLIDTIDLFKLINQKKKLGLWQFNLNRMAKVFLGINIENLSERHTAMFDVKTTHEALKAAVEYEK